jgi:hypothetical protein
MSRIGSLAARHIRAASKASCPLPKHSGLPKGTNHMSEQKKSFMQELDQWTDANVIDPLLDTGFEDFDADVLRERVGRIRQAIRQKVLESFRNGQQTAPKVAGKGGSHGR